MTSAVATRSAIAAVAPVIVGVLLTMMMMMMMMSVTLTAVLMRAQIAVSVSIPACLSLLPQLSLSRNRNPRRSRCCGGRLLWSRPPSPRPPSALAWRWALALACSRSPALRSRPLLQPRDGCSRSLQALRDRRCCRCCRVTTALRSQPLGAKTTTKLAATQLMSITLIFRP